MDPAVVVHFFGSKQGLFQAAVGWPFDPSDVLADVTGQGAEPLAAGLARTFLGFWEDPTTRASLLAVLRSAMTHAESAALLREFASRRLFNQISGALETPDAELQVNLAAAQLIGIALLRYVVRVEPIASASVNDLVDSCAAALATYLG